MIKLSDIKAGNTFESLIDKKQYEIIEIKTVKNYRGKDSVNVIVKSLKSEENFNVDLKTFQRLQLRRVK